LGDREEIVRLLSKELPQRHNIEELRALSLYRVESYYNSLAQSIAKNCTTKAPDCITLGAQLQQRLSQAKFLNVEIRKFLYAITKDDVYKGVCDNFDLELKVDSDLYELINNKGVKLKLPDIDRELVSEQEIWQIIQELTLMVMLQQKLLLSLDPIAESYGEVK